MKHIYLPLMTAVLLGMGSLSVANEPTSSPTVMTDGEMDKIVAGSGWHAAYVGGPGAPYGGNYIENEGEADRGNPRQGACVNCE
jgi:hypothetical protein